MVSLPDGGGAVVVRSGMMVVPLFPGSGTGVIVGKGVTIVSVPLTGGGMGVSVGNTVVSVPVGPSVGRVVVTSVGGTVVSVAVGGVTVVSVPFVTGGSMMVVTSVALSIGGVVEVGTSVGTTLDKMLEMTSPKLVVAVASGSETTVDEAVVTGTDPVPSGMVDVGRISDVKELRIEVIGSRIDVTSRMPEEEVGSAVVSDTGGVVVAGSLVAGSEVAVTDGSALGVLEGVSETWVAIVVLSSVVTAVDSAEVAALVGADVSGNGVVVVGSSVGDGAGVEVTLGSCVVSVVGSADVWTVVSDDADGAVVVATVEEASVVEDSGADVAVVSSLVAGAVDPPDPVNVTPALVLVVSSSGDAEGDDVVDSTVDVKLPPGPGIMMPPVVLEAELCGRVDSVGSSSAGVDVGVTIVDGRPPVD